MRVSTDFFFFLQLVLTWYFLIKVVLDIYGNSKCYGFVAFEDENVADTCVRKLNGREGCERTVS